jgi:transcriptional regulator with XRE-family HTH domain
MQEKPIGHRLRLLRAERGLTLREAAKRAGVAKETISYIERGETRPSDLTLAKLAKAYDVPLEELLEPVPA